MFTLTQRIMFRIYALALARFALSGTGMRLLGLAAALGTISASVSVKNVLLNMPSLYNLPALLTFHTDAFLHTSILVQAASLAALALLIASAKNLSRNSLKQQAI